MNHVATKGLKKTADQQAAPKGFAADFSDERVSSLQKYDHLLVRMWANLIGSPWFGPPIWIFALYPWLALYHHFRFFHFAKQLLFAKTQIQIAFHTFLSQFQLYFSGYLFYATPSTMVFYLSILLVNTLGNIADKLRVLQAL